MSNKTTKAGLPPGSLIHIGDQKVSETEATQITFAQGHFEELKTVDFQNLDAPQEANKLRWINVNGLHDAEAISKIGETFSFIPFC